MSDSVHVSEVFRVKVGNSMRFADLDGKNTATKLFVTKFEYAGNDAY